MAGPRTVSVMAACDADLHLEHTLLAEGVRLVGGCDEVGRGCLAGPVSVGLVIVGASTAPPPVGLRDSKLLSAVARERLVPAITGWVVSWAVGHATPDEIDRWGILPALRLAGERALASLPASPEVIVLDGNVDWLTGAAATGLARPYPGRVETRVKADMTCASVAAASVLAKVTRDRLMAELDGQYPAYGWGRNKGYGTADHSDAIRRLGPCEHHRRSWRLPGQDPQGSFCFDDQTM